MSSVIGRIYTVSPAEGKIFNQNYTNKHNKVIICVSVVERADRWAR